MYSFFSKKKPRINAAFFSLRAAFNRLGGRRLIEQIPCRRDEKVINFRVLPLHTKVEFF